MLFTKPFTRSVYYISRIVQHATVYARFMPNKLLTLKMGVFMADAWYEEVVFTQSICIAWEYFGGKCYFMTSFWGEQNRICLFGLNGFWTWLFMAGGIDILYKVCFRNGTHVLVLLRFMIHVGFCLFFSFSNISLSFGVFDSSCCHWVHGGFNLLSIWVSCL